MTTLATPRLSPRVLQTRGVELGRIRIGAQEAITRKDGKPGTRPVKLDRFRFTSAHQRHIEDLANLYGGQAQAWDNGGRPQWEVITEAKSIPVIVSPASLSQWMELWTGGGCVRRCDGERDTISDSPCLCEAEIANGRTEDRQCKPTTRVSVMLPELEAVGLWRLESHGWNAAAELPSTADLAAHVGQLVPARLLLDERITVREGRTNRFVVPVIDLAIQPRRLAEIVSGVTPAAIEAPTAPAIGAGEDRMVTVGEAMRETVAAIDVLAHWRDLIDAATTPEELRALYRQAVADKAPRPVIDAITARGRDLAGVTDTPPVTGAEEAAQGIQDVLDSATTPAEPVASEDVDTAWDRLVKVAGLAGVTSDAIHALVQQVTGKATADATAADLDTVRLTVERGHHTAAA